MEVCEYPTVRSVVLGAVVIAFGAVAFTWMTREPARIDPPRDRIVAGATRLPTRNVAPERNHDAMARASLERQITMLTARVADEAAKRVRLEEQVAELSAQLAKLGAAPAEDSGRGAETGAPLPSQHAVAEPAPAEAATAPSAMERALIAAGVEQSTAADLKRRHDDLAMSEIYLRDQATREQWLNTPRFNEELAAINEQRVSIRDEIGDDAYDRYLFAQGQTNRVRVDDVMSDSVAAQAGLQTGDIVLRYGDTRIFGPDDLVNETRAGRAGESTRVEIVRNGARMEVQVPRGPLGLRIAASQAEPSS